MKIPHQYQREGAILIEKFGGRALLSDAMGLGKTLQALLWTRRNPQARPVIVICPAGLKTHWQREALDICGIQGRILQSQTPDDVGLLPRDQFVIINYEVLQYWEQYLTDLNPKLIIIDEGQNITNLAAIRTQVTRRLCRNAKHVIIITGTPITNRHIELYPLIDIIKPSLFPSRLEYAEQFCVPEISMGQITYKESCNGDKLHQLLKEHMMIRRQVSDVAGELPKMQRFVIPIDIDDREEYDKAAEDFIGWMYKRNPNTEAYKAEELARMTYLKIIAARLKTPHIIDWIRSFLTDTDDKLVFFGVHLDFLHNLHEKFKKISTLVDGSIPPGPARDARCDLFKNNDKCRLFFGQLKAAGTGLNLVTPPGSKRQIRTVVHGELGWNPAAHAQASMRIERVADTLAREEIVDNTPKSCFFLVAARTIEENLCRLIQRKQQIIGRVLDGDDAKWDRLSIHDELIKEMRELRRA